MLEKVKKKNAVYYLILISGILAISFCLVTIGLSVTDSYISVYILATGIVLLGINRIGLHLHDFKNNLVTNTCVTVFIFLLAVFVGLTKYNIYFLISSMFGFSLTIITYNIFELRKDHTVQSIAYHVLCMIFVFLFSFVFFFPSIYAKHASSISNSNFIILCYAGLIIVSSGKNLLYSHHKVKKTNLVANIITKSLGREIILGLMIIIILCSVYFTLVEKNISSYVDALWYSFAVVTTIGFGDVSVTTTLGRILSVILGICGIAVVAVFTSFIVNFYNEMSKKREEKLLKKLIKESEKIEKLEEEIIDQNNEDNKK